MVATGVLTLLSCLGPLYNPQRGRWEGSWVLSQLPDQIDGGGQTGVEGEDRTLVMSQLPVKGTAEFCLLTSTCCGLRL